MTGQLKEVFGIYANDRRQQGGGKTGFFAQYRASTAEQKQKRKGIEKMQHGSLLSCNAFPLGGRWPKAG